MDEPQLVIIREPLTQLGVQAFVFLDGSELIHGGQQMLGKRTKARPDFQRLIGRLQVRGLGNAAQHILIVQQILPERLREAHGFLIQRAAHFIAVHDITFCSVTKVRSSCFSVMVSGGEKAITCPYSPAGRRI